MGSDYGRVRTTPFGPTVTSRVPELATPEAAPAPSKPVPQVVPSGEVATEKVLSPTTSHSWPFQVTASGESMPTGVLTTVQLAPSVDVEIVNGPTATSRGPDQAMSASSGPNVWSWLQAMPSGEVSTPELPRATNWVPAQATTWERVMFRGVQVAPSSELEIPAALTPTQRLPDEATFRYDGGGIVCAVQVTPSGEVSIASSPMPTNPLPDQASRSNLCEASMEWEVQTRPSGEVRATPSPPATNWLPAQTPP